MSANPRGWRPFLPLAALLAVVGALALGAARTGLGRALELKTLDWRFRAFADPGRHDPDIALVMLDQASLDVFEKDDVYWPWPRSLYAAALSFLKRGGAKAVVFDALFTSPSPYGAAEDKTFGTALKDFGPVVMAMETGRDPQPARAAPPPARFAVEAPSLAAAAETRPSVRQPIPDAREAARWLGDASVLPDPDGVFRRVPLAVRLGGRLYPTLAAAAAMAATGKSLEDLRPPLVDGKMLVNFHGKSLTDDPRLKTYAWYPLANLVAGAEALAEGKKPGLDPTVFKGKLVFVGMSAAGLLDNHPSPISPVYPGTEVVAAAADDLIRGDALRPAPAAALPLLVLAALVLAALASRLTARAGASFAAVLASSAGLAGAAALAFRRGAWLPLAAPELALWLGFSAAAAWSYAVEGRQKRYIQAAFGHYLSPEVVRRIAESPEALALGGERREVTVYFSDIAGFTTLSETLEPEKLARLMNRYLGEMTDAILASGGTLDKYIGDAIMAFWGAPVPAADHALTACRVALENQRTLARLREEFAAEGLPVVRNRIGLNSGPASIGNMGSPRRFSYTAIGDNVNLASRLEGANKAYGTYLMISESTRAAAGGAIEVRELDFVKVKGKNLPIRVYELLGLKGETDPGLLKKARLFESGLAHFRARRFGEAEAVFAAVAREFGEDRASEEYLQRCRGFRTEPPPPDWDGSRALTEK